MRRIGRAIGYIFSTAKSLFVAGILTMLPLAVTTLATMFIYSFAHHFLAPFDYFDIVLVIAGIMVIGAIGKFIFAETILHPLEKIIRHIPLAGALYSGVKSFVEFLNTSKHPEFKRQVVLVPFLQPDNYTLALMIGPADDDYAKLIPNLQEKMVKVWIPTNHYTPLGHFLIIPENKVIPTELTFEEATKAIVSCGIITPKTLLRKN